MNKLICIIILLGVLMTLNAETGYKLPADEIVEIYDTPRNPYIQFIQFENFGLEINYQLHQTLEQLAEPSLKLAGEKFSKRFDNLAKRIDGEIENLTNQNQLLKEARDILLPRLMTGMIDVEEIEVAV